MGQRWPRAALVLAVLGLTAGQGHGAAILHYDDGPQRTTVSQALTLLGHAATTTTPGWLPSALAAQPWDLVIVDASLQYLGDDAELALIDYAAGGGRVLLSYWDLDMAPALAAAYGAAGTSTFWIPAPFQAWPAGQALFSQPYVVSGPVTPMGPDDYGDNGDRLTVGSGVALAGFSASPAAGQAAIVAANGGATLLNGFLFDDFQTPQGVALVANEIDWLLQGSAVPEPGGWLCVAGAAWLWLRRRRGCWRAGRNI